MVSMSKVVDVLACGCLLVLSLSLQGFHTIKGEVWRVEPSFYYVNQYDGNQVRVHVDETTQMIGNIGQGEQIEA